MNARRLLYTLLAVLLFAHQDFWQWHGVTWMFGLPTGFLYHVVFCLVVALVMALLLRLDRDRESD